MEEIVDGDLLKYVVEGGGYFREKFFGKYPETKELVSSMSDTDIWRLNRGGHDPHKVYAAYDKAVNHKGSPTVIIAKTIKGYGMGKSGESVNTTHQQKKLDVDDLMYYRDRFDVPLTDAQVKNIEYFKPDENSEEIKYLKKFETIIPLENFSDTFKLYIGPNDYYILNDTYDGISDSIWFGWGIFGWINRNIFFPLYQFLSSFLSAGIAIIIMVILTRLIMSPVQYKMYLSQAKMKILRPEISAATEKFKDDPLKRNQETMRIYNQAGANPLSGCLPMFIQLPVFYALFCFFPVAFALRGESFLWADDLSVYDSILELPFYIPLYGDHVSLFPILAGVTMFFYTSVSGNQQMQPTQPGMPNMKFIMYFLPFTLMIFFNNFASGLSLYYTISNLLTIVIIYAIKNFIIDEKKILLKIEENKKKPKGEGRFQRRLRKLQEMAEKAENQRKNNR